MNYPNNIKKQYVKETSYGNRGMDLEMLVNMANNNYVDNDIALIYKKPTPIQIVKYDYNKKRITDAYYQTQSTLDYNGLYKGYYVEFDAKNTNSSILPLSNIASHQIKHIKRVLFHKGIAFLLIMTKNEIYALNGYKLIDFIDNNSRKSIPYEFIKNEGIKVDYSYLKGVNYITAVEEFIKENKNGKIKNEKTKF